MKTLLGQISAMALITVAGEAQASPIYQNNFDTGNASLSGFTTFGTASIQAPGGQLAIGVTGFNHGGVTLDMASMAGYSTTLSANTGMLTWAFNVANMNGAYNNQFNVILASDSSDPFNLFLPAQGYSFGGGGLVGNAMTLSRFDLGLNTYQTLIAIPDASGLGPLPQWGSVRITYEPSSDTWNLYMDIGLSPLDPTGISDLVGTAVDSTYTDSALPYFSLGGETSGTDYFDNLSISVAPEPSSFCLTIVGLLTLCWQVHRSHRSHQITNEAKTLPPNSPEPSPTYAMNPHSRAALIGSAWLIF